MRLAIILSLLLAGAASPALSQTANLEGRVGKIERELKAVQRKVFPGGSGATIEPEISAAPATITPAGDSASSPIADLASRVDALEREIATLTGQNEQNSFKVRQIEEAFAKFKADAEFRLNAIETGGRPATAAPVADGTPGPFSSTPPSSTNAIEARPASTASTSPAAPPASGDPGEDAYMAAYRLWETKRFPEAQEALKQVVAKYPKHSRATFAKNLLGRAYLDDGKPALAAQAFLDNYQKNPQGERAPDSLYYLGQSLTQLKKPAEACKVYDELRDVYGASLKEALKARVAQGRIEAKCAA